MKDRGERLTIVKMCGNIRNQGLDCRTGRKVRIRTDSDGIDESRYHFQFIPRCLQGEQETINQPKLGQFLLHVETGMNVVLEKEGEMAEVGQLHFSRSM